jgi:hypothetical protein
MCRYFAPNKTISELHDRIKKGANRRFGASEKK